MFNMQSGSHRQSFPPRGMKRKSNIDFNDTKHTKAVTGLWVDGLNQTITSCGLDGKVKVSLIKSRNVYYRFAF